MKSKGKRANDNRAFHKVDSRATRKNGHRPSDPFKLVTRRQIRAVVNRIVATAHPEKVILFGSYAYGKPTVNSDVDLMVVMESDVRPARRGIPIEYALLDVPFPMDIMVRTPQELEQRSAIGDFFIKEVLERGQVLYAR